MRLRKSTLASVLLTLAVGMSASLQAQPRPESGEEFGPAPRNADGRVVLGGATPAEKGVWTPRFSIFDPVAPVDVVPFKPWAKALYDERQLHELEPHARCKASGGSRQFLTPYGVEFVEITALQKLYIFDIGGPHTYRVVYMDGRSHPANPEPSNYGHSVGWWEGDTLVIDTVGFNDLTWFDFLGNPHSTELHTIERYTRIDYNTLENITTVIDPAAYTQPFTIRFTARLQPADWDIMEYVCNENNQDVDHIRGPARLF